MPFLSLSLVNFRNIQNGTIDLLSKEVYFIGENGQGKSNLLESLYIAAYGASFRTRLDTEITTTGCEGWSVKALYKSRDEHTHTIHVQYRDNRKKIEKNAKQILDRKVLVDTLPCILFCHSDLDFAVGSPDRRRFFIDQSLSLFDPVYIDVLRAYRKILKSRNTVLKDGQQSLLDVLDVQLSETGLEIVKRRRRVISAFNQVFSRLYKQVSGIEGVSLEYLPSWKEENADHILTKLIGKRDWDLRMGTSMSGPHRDRIRFIKNGHPFVPTASTGQLRLLSLVLRSAQAVFYTETTGAVPVLLMDDVLLELDPAKRERFSAALPEYDQLFCTFLPGEPYERYKRSTTRLYTVTEGHCHE